MKTPREVVEELRDWLLLEAGKLPADAKRDVLAALVKTNPEFACIELFRLQAASKVPSSWDGRIKQLWDCAR